MVGLGSSMPAADDRLTAGPLARPEGEPHLTFGVLLADTLHEMAVHEDTTAADPDDVERLRDRTLSAMRAFGGTPLAHPFHHAYLTPTGTPAQPSRPSRLDVRY
jgi:Zn-dependent protease